MEREHCSSVDSCLRFTTSNYGVCTTSEIEWLYVCDPEGGLGRVGESHWPSETKSLEQQRRRGTGAGAVPLSAFDGELERVNGLLGALGEPSVICDELVAGRLRPRTV